MIFGLGSQGGELGLGELGSLSLGELLGASWGNPAGPHAALAF